MIAQISMEKGTFLKVGHTNPFMDSDQACHYMPFRKFLHIVRISEPLQIRFELEILPKN